MIGFPKRTGFLLGGVFLLLISAGVYCGSDNGVEDGPGEVAVGSRAPDFSLEDYSGQEVKLSDFRGGQTAVLVFLRSFF